MYIEAMLEDGDARAVPVALRTIADCVGGMGVLAQKTKFPCKTLHRALSGKGSPRMGQKYVDALPDRAAAKAVKKAAKTKPVRKKKKARAKAA